MWIQAKVMLFRGTSMDLKKTIMQEIVFEFTFLVKIFVNKYFEAILVVKFLEKFFSKLGKY